MNTFIQRVEDRTLIYIATKSRVGVKEIKDNCCSEPIIQSLAAKGLISWLYGEKEFCRATPHGVDYAERLLAQRINC